MVSRIPFTHFTTFMPVKTSSLGWQLCVFYQVLNLRYRLVQRLLRRCSNMEIQRRITLRSKVFVRVIFTARCDIFWGAQYTYCHCSPLYVLLTCPCFALNLCLGGTARKHVAIFQIIDGDVFHKLAIVFAAGVLVTLWGDALLCQNGIDFCSRFI